MAASAGSPAAPYPPGYGSPHAKPPRAGARARPLHLAFDQSGYVSNAINGLVREAVLGAVQQATNIGVVLGDDQQAGD